MRIGELIAPIVTRPQTTSAASTTSEPSPTPSPGSQTGMAQEDRMLRRVALDQMFQEYKGLQNPGRQVERKDDRPRRKKRGRKWMKRVARDLRETVEGGDLLRSLRRARQVCRRVTRRWDDPACTEPERRISRFVRGSRMVLELLIPIQDLVHLYRGQANEPDLPRHRAEAVSSPEEDGDARRIFTMAAASELGLTGAEVEMAQTLWNEGLEMLARAEVQAGEELTRVDGPARAHLRRRLKRLIRATARFNPVGQPDSARTGE
ncbi:MAG: hypothetical protein AB1758_22835 [Candidatus Eremiobacterota bacterium]